MKRNEGMPGLVYWGLWGLNSRRAAVGFMAFSAIAGAACLAYGFLRNPVLLIGGLMFVSTVWYWLSIRWMDAHGQWNAGAAPATAPSVGTSEAPRE